MFGFALDGTPGERAAGADHGRRTTAARSSSGWSRTGCRGVFAIACGPTTRRRRWKSVRVLPPPQLAPLRRPAVTAGTSGLPGVYRPPGPRPARWWRLDRLRYRHSVRIRAATDRPVARAWIELATDPPRPALRRPACSPSVPHGPAGVSCHCRRPGRRSGAECRRTLDGDRPRFELIVPPIRRRALRPAIRGRNRPRRAADTRRPPTTGPVAGRHALNGRPRARTA